MAAKRIVGRPFTRFKQDAYDTPAKAVIPLLGVLPPNTVFIEPCGGKMQLADELEKAGHICLAATDIEPRDSRVAQIDAFDLDVRDATIITNPPFSVGLQLLRSWLTKGAKDVWLLIPLDWLANLNFTPFVPHLAEWIPIGRVKWIEGSQHLSKENFIWARFVSEVQAHQKMHERPDIPWKPGPKSKKELEAAN